MAGNVRLIEEVADSPAPEGLTQEDLAAAFARLEQMGVDGVVTPTAPKVIVKRAMPDREILAAMSGLGAVLAVRMMLTLAVIGGWWLAFMAMGAPSIMGISVLVAYALTTVGPLTYLSTKRA